MRNEASDGSLLVLVSLSGRDIDYHRCSLNFLTARYSDPRRLSNLPPFTSLPSLRDGSLSHSSDLHLYLLRWKGEETSCTLIRVFHGDGKIQHAAVAEDLLVVCYEDRLELWRDWLEPGTPPTVERIIHDPWFAGLHTVFVEGSRCVLSSSAADAVIELDMTRGEVVARNRLPATLYGTNYELDESTCLRTHYIHNDIQLAHLNCAFPDREGNVWMSTLIQGDIARFDANGRFQRVATGYVGAHGVRRIAGDDTLYFVDSCMGTLVLMDTRGQIVRRYATPSRWLHDALWVGRGWFLLAPADLRKLILADIFTGRERDIHVSETDQTIQFLNYGSSLPKSDSFSRLFSETV